jgi:hypothetical protein
MALRFGSGDQVGSFDGEKFEVKSCYTVPLGVVFTESISFGIEVIYKTAAQI